MGEHDWYGKRLLSEVFSDGELKSVTRQNYECGGWFSVDAETNEHAIEIESRTSKQIRGAVLDLLMHPAPKKLLIIQPIHSNNAQLCAAQCRETFLKLSKSPAEVIVLSDYNDEQREERDLKTISDAVARLREA